MRMLGYLDEPVLGLDEQNLRHITHSCTERYVCLIQVANGARLPHRIPCIRQSRKEQQHNRQTAALICYLEDKNTQVKHTRVSSFCLPLVKLNTIAAIGNTLCSYRISCSRIAALANLCGAVEYQIPAVTCLAG